MSRLIVTGGCGFIGSNFVRHLLSTDADVSIVNVDKLTYAGNLENLKDVEKNPRYRFVHADIVDKSAMETLIGEVKPDALINFAAESHVDRSILDSGPFIQTNIVGT